MFKFWSESNKDANSILKPDLGLRVWDDLDKEEKDKIWHHLSWYFFDAQIERRRDIDAIFFGEYKWKVYIKKTITRVVLYINETYKAKSFAEAYLRNPSVYTACQDFHSIFMNQKESVVMELLSAYAIFLYEITKEDEYIYKSEKETEKDYIERKVKTQFHFFDDFSTRINDVFMQFGIKYHLTRDGFIPRQDQRIIEEIYEPVLGYLSDPKWKEVNNLLADSFKEYRQNTPQGYSNCITNTVSGVQAFLQILVNSNTGKGDISKLILTAIAKNLLPNDIFTQNIFKNIESILAKERQESGIAHPKKEYANEKNARTILNLAMIFLQHCIQK